MVVSSRYDDLSTLSVKSKSRRSLMKKVRYIVGAMGLAPVVGLGIMPAAHAATVTQMPNKNAKTVSLTHVRGPESPLTTCGSSHHKTSQISSATNEFLEDVTYSNGGNGCMKEVTGTLAVWGASYSMRTRVYSKPNGSKVLSKFVGGSKNIFDNAVFKQTVEKHAEQACVALVWSSNHANEHTVLAGPI